MEDNIIRIGTLYSLNEKYCDSYNLAIITYDVEIHETIVELISSWNSTYNKIVKVKHSDPLDVANEYRK